MPSVTKATFSASFFSGTTIDSHGASDASGAAGTGSFGSVSRAIAPYLARVHGTPQRESGGGARSAGVSAGVRTRSATTVASASS